MIRIRVISRSGLYWSEWGWTKCKAEATVFTNYKDAHACMRKRDDPWARCKTTWVNKKPKPKPTDRKILDDALAALISLGHGKAEALRLIKKADESGQEFKDMQELIQWCYKK